MSLAVINRDQDAGVASLPLDDDGFLIDHRLWSHDLPQKMATHLGLGPLGPTQWMVIEFVRDRHFRLGALPPMRNLCRKLGVDRDVVKKAFGGCRELSQVAGLPNPGSEALSYMG